MEARFSSLDPGATVALHSGPVPIDLEVTGPELDAPGYPDNQNYETTSAEVQVS
jgi:hypothetical protein